LNFSFALVETSPKELDELHFLLGCGEVRLAFL
jgi:hypothetical protein